MLSYNYLLAAALLTSPPGAPEPVGGVARFPALKQPLQEVALRWELLDQRETRYILARPEDFLSDLNLLRRRYQDHGQAPLLNDSLRFPDRETANAFLALNRAYRQHINVRQPVELLHWYELGTALRETERLYQIWEAVRDARCEHYYVTVRRQALQRLRELVGEEAYYHGDLPPCVPLWRFRPNN
jgi:hypothetical protein